MRHNRTRAHGVIDSEIPGGLDVFFQSGFTATGDVAALGDTNERRDSTGHAVNGRVNVGGADAGIVYVPDVREIGSPSVTFKLTVENRGGTDGGGAFSDPNPDSCNNGDGTQIEVVVEFADAPVRMGDEHVGEQARASACVPDSGILPGPGVGNYDVEIPPRWVGSDAEIGDEAVLNVWAEGGESGVRVTQKYQVVMIPVETADDSGGGGGDGGGDDETDDGGGGGDQPPLFGSSFTVTNREWREEGDEIVVDVTIEGGDGGAQSIPVTYYIDGIEFDSGFIAGQGVAEGNTESDEGDIDLAEIEPGDHLLEVEVGDAGITEVDTITVEEQPSGDPAAQLSIKNCDAGQFGSGAAVSADIANTSQSLITTDVQMLVDGQTAATIEAVTIPGGQSQPISQQVSLPNTPGDYQISISTTNSSYQ